jgi:hypothetical protein
MRLVTSNSLRRKFIVVCALHHLLVVSGVCFGLRSPDWDHWNRFAPVPQVARAPRGAARNRAGNGWANGVVFSKIFGGWPMATAMMESAEEVKRRIGELNLEHRDLDRAIEALEVNPLHDELQLKRLKKRKLMLKDQIFMLQRQLVPDIPA